MENLMEGLVETVARRSYGKLVAFLAARIEEMPGYPKAISGVTSTATLPRTGSP